MILETKQSVRTLYAFFFIKPVPKDNETQSRSIKYM